MEAVNSKWIFVGGMIRSGSTLQYQILSELVFKDLGGTALGFKEAADLDAFLDASETNPEIRFPCVVKSHVCTAGIRERLESGAAVAFYTYRDIRDVVVSGSRSFSMPIDDFISGRLIDETIGEGYLWRSNPSAHVSSFEVLMGDMAAWISGMMAHLGITGGERGRVAELVETFSIRRQKERLQSAVFGDVQGFAIDPATLLHKDHIHRAEIEGWRGTLSDEQVRAIEIRASDWMIERGYEPGLPDGEIQGEGFLLALRSRMAIYFQESDRILLEREELSKHLAAEAEALRIRLIENHALFERALDQPQSLPRWLSLQWRRVRRKLSAKRLSES